MKRRLLIFLVIGAAFLIPVAAQAADWLPIVPCGSDSRNQPICNPCHLFQTAKNITDLILYGITGPIAAFMIVFSGGQMLISAGNPAVYGAAQKRLTNVMYGVGIILLAWLATNFLIKTLGNGTVGDTWNEFTCPVGLASITNIQTEFPAGAPPQFQVPEVLPSEQLSALPFGAVCPDSNVKLYFAPGTIDCGGCPKYQSAIATYAGKFGVSASLLESIMYHESGCVLKSNGGAGAYGLMQVKPDTVKEFRDICDVYQKKEDGSYHYDADGNKEPIEITPGWLMSAQSAEASICLSAAYIKNRIMPSCGSDPRNIAAGYNAGEGYCRLSKDCQGLTSPAGGPLRAWECLWDNPEHTVCNADRAGGSLEETRRYAPRVAACVL